MTYFFLITTDEQKEVDRQLRKVGRDIERDRRQLERDENKLVNYFSLLKISVFALSMKKLFQCYILIFDNFLLQSLSHLFENINRIRSFLNRYFLRN